MGEIKSKLDTAGWGLQSIIRELLQSVGTQMVSTIISIAIIFWINPLMSLFAVAGLSFFLILSVAPVLKAGDLENKLYNIWDKSYGKAEDAMTNIQAVKQATTEDYERTRFEESMTKELAPIWVKNNEIWQTMSFNQQVTILSLQIIVFLWSLYLIQVNQMTIGELISFNAYLGILFGPFSQLLSMSKTLQSGIVNISSVEKSLSIPSENYLPTNAVEKEIKGDLEFKNVNFLYHKNQPVLKNINVKINSGEVVALVGESGVGKSTFIDLISAYNLPTNGKIFIDGVDIKKIGLKSLRSQIAIVPQEVLLFNESIESNIIYGNFKATKNEIKTSAQKAHALEFIEKLPKKWNQLVGERGVKLSGGQKQRVAIARAILRNPKILILDEPTSALDAKSEKIIQDSLEELMRGRTTFIIAHRLSTVRRADKILVFKDGEIVETGKHDELIQRRDGVYRHLYELQVGLHQ